MRNLGTVEILIIAAVLMVFFGSKKIPEFAKSLGEAGREFRKGFTKTSEDNANIKDISNT